MNLKKLPKICAFLLSGMIAVASASLIANKSLGASQQEERQIPINTTQLPLEDGAFPVEIRCGDARSSAPNRLDEFSCLVINNTSKRISALAVIYSVGFDGSTGEARETNMITYDFVIHPDIREAKHLKLLPQRESRTVRPSGPVTFEVGTVSSVQAHIDYVEFEDKTSIGPNTQGSKMIDSMREGAARYKAWLVHQYKRKKMEANATAVLLENSDLPQELNFNGDPDMTEGARLYQRIMRKVYTSQGSAELKRYLNK